MATTGRTFEAVILDWDECFRSDRPVDAGAVLTQVAALCAAGVHVVVMDDTTTGDQGMLPVGTTGAGRLMLCKTIDALRWTMGWLGQRGITGGLVLVASPKLATDALHHDPLLVPELERAVVAPPIALGDILGEQITRRAQHRVPAVDDDPAWVIEIPDDPARERVAEAIGTLANGSVGLRGSFEEGGRGSSPLFVANGVYTDDVPPRLLEGPVWTHLEVHDAGHSGRQLDLRTGVLIRRDARSGFTSTRFVSAVRPDVGALRAEGPLACLDVADPFGSAAGLERSRASESVMARTATRDGAGIAVATRDRNASTGGQRLVERIAAWSAHPREVPAWADVASRLEAADGLGFDRLLAEHREEWARRWAHANVTIEGAADDQLAARFAVFHLLGAAPEAGEAAVGPRGLTGHAYGGHVFWDADVYVLPALAAIDPSRARAMLEYRIRRLPAAQAAARAQGCQGARFPWESARDGEDVTPHHIRGPGGRPIVVRTGEQQAHISADIAWAAHEYANWTGDVATLQGPARPLLLDIARYWACRARLNDDGHAHIDDVMGPDEYHHDVDDNAYTNVLVGWSLRRAADLNDQTGGDAAESAGWRDLAARLVDGWDDDRRLHEQFAGYWNLESLLAESIAPRPFAADVLLGRRRVADSQLIKQPDVLMLHHLIPDELQPGSLDADLSFYEPRTSHGSSLSPAIHSALFARAGRSAEALEAFRLASRLDLDDVTGTTAAGLHLATMGGVWQALAYGFLGLRPRSGHLEIAPRLPAEWRSLSLGLRFHGRELLVHAEHDALHVECDEPIDVRVATGAIERCEPPGHVFPLARRTSPGGRSPR